MIAIQIFFCSQYFLFSTDCLSFFFLFCLILSLMLKCFWIWGGKGLFVCFEAFFFFWPGSSLVSYHILVCSVKKLIGNLMCFNQACSVGLGYFDRASPNITTYMYIFSVGLGSFPRNVFSNVFRGEQNKLQVFWKLTRGIGFHYVVDSVVHPQMPLQD